MKNFEFKSQICTTKEQSEMLLALGLKKETADMEIEIFKGDNTISGYVSKGYWENEISDALIELIPAWSFSRLLELLYNGAPASVRNLMKLGCNEMNYATIIDCIDDLVKLKQFNKDYLEEKK